MGYYIKQIPNNKFNKYKYGYLDHMETLINMKDHYWNFAMELYCADNSSLPLNTLTLDMQLPYQTVSNVQFNLASDQTGVKDKVVYNIDYAKKYIANFNVDISQNEFLKQKLSNAKIDINLQMQIDPDPISKASFGPKQEDLDGLINEYGEQRFNFFYYYTNTHKINKQGQVQNDYGFQLKGGNECVRRCALVNCVGDDLLYNKQSIIQLANINSLDDFQVLSAKVKFNYWIGEDTETKSIESELNVKSSLTKNINIEFTKSTNYDFVNNKVILDPLGINGFYIPKASHGYFELELKINQNNNINNFVITNNFVFDNVDVKPYIGCCQITINSLEDFKEILF